MIRKLLAAAVLTVALVLGAGSLVAPRADAGYWVCEDFGCYYICEWTWIQRASWGGSDDDWDFVLVCI
mgnify:CR=1 FL=1